MAHINFELHELLQAAYQRLGQMNVSVATGGSTTTVVDSTQAGLHGDNAWKPGAVFIMKDSTMSTTLTPPEGQFSLVSAYADSTGTWTIGAVTTAVAAGDVFGYTNDFFPLYTMVELANQAVWSFGPIPLINSSITTAAGQTEYSYPVAIKMAPPLRVEYNTKLNDSDDNQWAPIDNWRYQPATAGTAATIVLPQLPSGRTVRIWYEGWHPALNAWNDVIAECLAPEAVIAKLVKLALQWQNTRLQGGDDFLLQRETQAAQEVVEIEAKTRMWKPRRRPRLLVIGQHIDEDQFDYPDPA